MDELGQKGFSAHSRTAAHLRWIIEDTDATNEYINDGNVVQPLTALEIEALKKSGIHASVRPYPYGRTNCEAHPMQEIIKRQIEQHANYQLKTEYSKEKYKKRKEAKYVHHLSV